MAEHVELDGHHKATVEKIFSHPVGHNISGTTFFHFSRVWRPSPRNATVGSRWPSAPKRRLLIHLVTTI